ncbi:hypothetical protein CAPTEDRAFT_178659, partial [Capitella teleta]
ESAVIHDCKQLSYGVKIRLAVCCSTPEVKDPCESNPCKNGGLCVAQGSTSFTCDCSAGFEGSTCESEISPCNPNPCLNGGSCVDLIDGYNCSCHDGFTGSKCETEVQACDCNPCRSGGTCIKDGSSFKCICPPGRNGRLCERSESKFELHDLWLLCITLCIFSVHIWLHRLEPLDALPLLVWRLWIYCQLP